MTSESSRTPGSCSPRRLPSACRSRISSMIGCVLGVRGAASRAGRKVMTLIYAMVLGADSIDDCDVLRCRAAPAGCWAAGSRRRRRSARSCVRSRSDTSASLTACSPRRSSARGRTAGAGPGDRAPDDRCRFVCRRGSRLRQAGRRVRLHPQARLSPDPRLARGDRRGAAPAPAQGIGEHAARDPALLRRADRKGSARRRDGAEAVARRLGLLERQGVRQARAGRLDVLDRHPDGQARPRRHRSDRRDRVDDDQRLPRQRTRRRSPKRCSATAA